MPVDLIEAVLHSQRFREVEAEVAIRSLLRDYPTLQRSHKASVIEWFHALQVASLLLRDESAEPQAAALRIIQGCLQSDAPERARDTAMLLLERMGNAPAIELAEARGLGQAADESALTLIHQMDVLRRRNEFTIWTPGMEPMRVNPFQRDFWRSASIAKWVSVSAPTSAGKSYVVKRWLQARLAQDDRFSAVYIVPTRALVEEVSLELKTWFQDGARIYTIPWDKDIRMDGAEIFVLTQERLHFLLDVFPRYGPDLIFIDEAQKVGDRTRGILLRRVLGDCVARNESLQVIFASPLAENPQVLLEDAPANLTTGVVDAESITVVQHVLWIQQVPRKPKLWDVSTIVGNDEILVGRLTLQDSPGPGTKRLPLVAFALGSNQTGNVVYVNGAAAAESAAKVLFDAYGPEGRMSPDSPVWPVIDLIAKTIHPGYSLVKTLERGVAFHYGNMPQLIRSELERLLRDGVIRFLVCTATLLEGVNLPCRTIYARGPKKGSGNPMSAADFWNLAGRAGRWGKEFQGSVVCVDIDRADQWPSRPRQRVKQPIRHAYKETLTQTNPLLRYIRGGGLPTDPDYSDQREYTFNYLCKLASTDGGITELDAHLAALPAHTRQEVGAAIASVLQNLKVPTTVFARHPGVSPTAMDGLLAYFNQFGTRIEDLILAAPDSNDAAGNYEYVLALVGMTLGGDFGEEKRRRQLAYLIMFWMRGYPLARIIADRWKFESSRPNSKSLDRIIRDVMTDIEKYARYEVPKYLDCYSDVLGAYAERVGQAAAVQDGPDIAMMLELGVSRVTDVSLLALGLSRTSAVMISERLVQSTLSPEQALAWLRSNRTILSDFPSVVLREVDNLLESSPVPAAEDV